jgi:hypothetical protein
MKLECGVWTGVMVMGGLGCVVVDRAVGATGSSAVTDREREVEMQRRKSIAVGRIESGQLGGRRLEDTCQLPATWMN